MTQHQRDKISITQEFPVGKELFVYCRDGLSRDWGKWSAIIKGLDLDRKEITIQLSQDWQGADTRGGQYWTETKTIKFDDFLIPIIEI